jgi:peptide/nickel transport system substrate-binding protein
MAMKTIHVSEMAIARPDVPNPDTYTFASSITSRTIDPVECTGAFCRPTLIALTENLVWYPPGGDAIIPRLAKSYELSPDQTKYTFYLEEGVKFWNGDEVTADDVVYTFQRYLIMNLPGTWCDRINLPMTGIGVGEKIPDSMINNAVVAVDKYTVEFNLIEPYAPFLDTLALPACGIISKDYAETHGSVTTFNERDPSMQTGEALMGSGPYELKRFVPNERTVLERFDDFHGEAAKIKTIVWLDIVEWSTRQTMLLAGDIDATDGEASQVAVIEREEGVNVGAYEHGMVENLYFGYDRDMSLQPVGAEHRPDIMNDIHMRRGMAFAFPYEQYLQEAWLGLIEKADSNLMPGLLGYFPYQEDLVTDLAMAEEEFKLAWDGEVWENGFKMAFGYQPWMAEGGIIMGNLLAENLQKINPKFELIISMASWPTLLYYPLYPAWAQAGPDPMWYNYNWRSTYGLFADYANYYNAELDELLDEALIESVPANREALYKQATDIMKDDIGMIHVCYPPTFYISRDWIHNIEDSWQAAWYVDTPYYATLEKY